MPICAAVGAKHSSVVWGGVDGGVMGMNPMRKLLAPRGRGWMQCLYRYDWVRRGRRKKKEEEEEKNRDKGSEEREERETEKEAGRIEAEKEPHTPPPQAVAEQPEKNNETSSRGRILEGFKLQQSELARAGGKTVEGTKTVVSTIYEEEQQVKAVAWGREVEVGGWLAVGWGSGLVRVEDVAI